MLILIDGVGLLPHDRQSISTEDSVVTGHRRTSDPQPPHSAGPRHSARTAGASLQEALPRWSGEGVPTAPRAPLGFLHAN
jgi:hypothetical protein